MYERKCARVYERKCALVYDRGAVSDGVCVRAFVRVCACVCARVCVVDRTAAVALRVDGKGVSCGVACGGDGDETLLILLLLLLSLNPYILYLLTIVILY